MLVVEHLVAGYGDRALARPPHLAVAPGETALLPGSSRSGKPRLILADEPTASLDDAECTYVAGLLQRAAVETGRRW